MKKYPIFKFSPYFTEVNMKLPKEQVLLFLTPFSIITVLESFIVRLMSQFLSFAKLVITFCSHFRLKLLNVKIYVVCYMNCLMMVPRNNLKSSSNKKSFHKW